MKKLLKGLYMSFGMFCAIPVPKLWDDDCTGMLMPCFPVVGAVIGLIWWGVSKLLVFSGINSVLAAAVLALVPFFAAGFIHLDGFIDTSDAVLSRRPLEDKIRILKDPNAGAFAVIMLGLVFVLQFAAAFAVLDNGKFFRLLIVIPIISRCGSAFSLLCLRPAEFSGYVKMFRNNTGAAHMVVVLLITLVAVALSYVFEGVSGLITVAAVVFGYTAAMVCAFSGFKAVSGDLAGFALVVSELCGLVALAVVRGI